MSDNHMRAFDNPNDVADHLQATGWKVSRASVYKHAKQGKLLPNAAGVFPLDTVERYAKLFLKQKSTGRKVTDRSVVLNESRLEADIRRLKAQAERAEIDVAKAKGELIPRGQVEHEIVGRAIILRSSLSAMVRADAAALIDTVGGQAARLPEFIERLDSLIRTAVSTLARPAEFEIEVTE